MLERARPPRQYPAKYKAEILAEYERLDKAGKGALLRREGLYTSLISEWRKQRDRGAMFRSLRVRDRFGMSLRSPGWWSRCCVPCRS